MNNWPFGIAIIICMSFLIYYMTTPFNSKDTSLEQPTKDAIYLQKLLEKSQAITDTQKKQQEEPYIAQDEKKEIIPAKSGSMTIPFYTKSTSKNVKFFQAQINNIPTEIMLDTGATVIALNTSTIQQLQINQFGNPYTVNTANGQTMAYPFLARSVKLGNIEIHDIECAYVPSLKDNLLGGTFLKNFDYTISEQNQTVEFTPINKKVVLAPENQRNNAHYQPYEENQAGWIEVDGKKKYLLTNGQITEYKK